VSESTGALSDLETVAEWSRVFRDLTIWRPLVEAVLRRHDLASCWARLEIEAGRLGGTHAVFTVNDRLVVKLYAPFWPDDHQREAAVLGRLAKRGPLAGSVEVPRLLASGSLDARVPGSGGREWPYAVTRYVPGVPLGEVWPGLGPDARRRVASQLGAALADLHRSGLDGLEALLPAAGRPAGSLDAAARRAWDLFVSDRRQAASETQRQWGALPDMLARDLDGFLRGLGPLPRPEWRPALLSCDVTADHVLVAGGTEAARVCGLIDFGDAMIGDPEYEFVVVYLSALQLDPAAFAAMLAAYGHEADVGLGARIMAYALLHKFSLFGELPGEVRRRLLSAPDLETAAQMLWAGLPARLPVEPELKVR